MYGLKTSHDCLDGVLVERPGLDLLGHLRKGHASFLDDVTKLDESFGYARVLLDSLTRLVADTLVAVKAYVCLPQEVREWTTPVAALIDELQSHIHGCVQQLSLLLGFWVLMNVMGKD